MITKEFEENKVNLKKNREKYNLHNMKYYYFFFYELTILANSISCFRFIYYSLFLRRHIFGWKR